MKIVAVFTAIVCANLYFCPGIHGYADDPCKPSAHIECSGVGTKIYSANTVIEDFSASSHNSHLVGGMTYRDGNLTVPTSGRYYIYANLNYHNNGRLFIQVGNNVLSMIAPASDTPPGGSGGGTNSASGLFKLNAGDSIYLKTYSNSELYMGSGGNSNFYSYFGAYMI